MSQCRGFFRLKGVRLALTIGTQPAYLSGPHTSVDARLVDDWSKGALCAFEAKTRFGELLDRVAKGEEVVITRHDKPVARLVPEGAHRLDDVRLAVAGLRELQQRIRRRSKAKLSKRDVRKAIDEGRL